MRRNVHFSLIQNIIKIVLNVTRTESIGYEIFWRVGLQELRRGGDKHCPKRYKTRIMSFMRE